MKLRSGKSAAMVSGAAVTALFTCAAIASREPLLERYCLWRLGSPDDTAREAAAERLGRMGSARALPYLFPLEEWDILEALSSFETYCRQEGLSHRLRGVVSDFERMQRHSYEPLSRYLSGLRASGATESQILRLARQLSDPRDAMRTSVAYLLGQLGQRAEPAVPDLMRLLNDGSRYARIHAVKSLGNIGAASKPAVTALIGLLEGTDHVFRGFAAEALGEIGRPAQAAMPALRELVSNEDEVLRKIAARALQRIGER